jgi:hypothetical protein
MVTQRKVGLGLGQDLGEDLEEIEHLEGMGQTIRLEEISLVALDLGTLEGPDLVLALDSGGPDSGLVDHHLDLAVSGLAITPPMAPTLGIRHSGLHLLLLKSH